MMRVPRMRPFGRLAAWRRGAALLNVRGDFGSVRDSKGRAQFSPFWLSLVDAGDTDAHEWAANWRARQYTHVVICPNYGYPGSPVEGRSFGTDRFCDLVTYTLNEGFSPICILSDLPDERERVLDIVRELKRRGLLAFVIIVSAWEAINTSYYTTKQYSDLLTDMHAIGGDEIVIGVHLQPGRGSFSSHPLEVDDPFHGEEKTCWIKHPEIRIFLYQFEHGFTEHRDPEGRRYEPDWQNRFRDGVPRLGGGLNGWPIMAFCLFETVLYDSYRGHVDERRAREVASEAQKIAREEFGVEISFGNGAPL